MIYDHIRWTDKKSVTLYHPIKPSLDVETPLWVDLEEEESTHPLLTIGRALNFKNETEDDTINSFISDSMTITQHAYQVLDSSMNEIDHLEELTEEALVKNVETVPIIENFKSVPIEIEP